MDANCCSPSIDFHFQTNKQTNKQSKIMYITRTLPNPIQNNQKMQ